MKTLLSISLALSLLAIVMGGILFTSDRPTFPSLEPIQTQLSNLQNSIDAMEEEIILGADTRASVGGHIYSLRSPVSSSATSITLSSLTLKQTGNVITMTNFGTLGHGTIEPGSEDRQEFVTFTGITQNANGSATLTGVSRGIEPISPYTASTTYQFSHAGGSKFVLSDPPSFFNDVAFKGNDETITGQWLYSDLPETSSSLTATTTNQFATKEYVDSVSNQGAATSSETVAGIIEQATQIEMASSTAFDADNPHTINSEFATSTPDGTSQAGLFAIISRNNGKLHQLWLDLTENITFSGLFTTTATTTIATTSADKLSIATTTDESFRLQVQGDSYIDGGGLGVGVPTTTNGVIETSGNILVGGDVIVTGDIRGNSLQATTSSLVCSSGAVCTRAVSCDSGYNEVISGGFVMSGGVRVAQASRRTASTTWTVTMNSVVDTNTLTVSAICIAN